MRAASVISTGNRRQSRKNQSLGQNAGEGQVGSGDRSHVMWCDMSDWIVLSDRKDPVAPTGLLERGLFMLERFAAIPIQDSHEA